MHLLIRLVVLGSFLVTLSSYSAPVEAFYKDPGTRRMSKRLQEWHKEFGDRHPLENRARVKQLKSELLQAHDPAQRLALRYELATEQLNLGEPEATLTTLTNLYRDARSARLRISHNDRREMRMLEGMAYLRVGELENCVHHHNPDSCLVPIRGSGQHVKRRGAENAEAIFHELATQKTNDLGARWLLNIAAMTLGKYPDGVPEAFRVPPSIFESESPFPRFPDMATKLGIGDNSVSGGTVVEDFDGDGLFDVLLSKWDTLGQCILYRNLGNGRFEDVTRKAGLHGVTGGLNVMQADYNNDGHMDIYVVRGAWLGEMGLLPDSLLRNNGDGTFADVTEEAGLLSWHPALSAVWFDANNDGWIDLFVGNESTSPEFPHLCELFVNQKDGTFKEIAGVANAAVLGFVRGVCAGDFDNDGRTDLYISRLNQENVLLRNESSGTEVKFVDRTAPLRVGEPVMSFPTWFWDFNNDGWLDLWVSGYGDAPRSWYSASAAYATVGELLAAKLGLPSKAETFRLYENQRGAFRDVTEAANLKKAVLAMSANFGDLDNDGFLDFYTGTGAPSFGSLVPNEMFRNAGGRTFQDITTAGGFGHLQKGHAIAFADLNNDGAQEVVLNLGGAYPGDTFFDALFVNPGTTNACLSLRLVGEQSNRAAIGARIKVVASEKASVREIHRVVSSGGSFGSSPLRQHVGLAQCEKIDRVEIWWPASRQTNVLTSLRPNHVYEIHEGQTEARVLTPKQFAWPIGN